MNAITADVKMLCSSKKIFLLKLFRCNFISGRCFLHKKEGLFLKDSKCIGKFAVSMCYGGTSKLIQANNKLKPTLIRN